jgi:methylated-DNA-[protein]-cysteine S-methyltransferase
MAVFTSYYSSPVGLLKLQCSDQELTGLIFAKDEDQAPNDRHHILDLTTKQLDEYFSGSRKDFEITMLQEGSLFQRKVWQLLCNIPYGRTISYQELSRQYGDLKAIRAIASANGKNNLAIIVPCHRVIGSDRSLTGYAGGLWRKQWLLEHETKFSGGMSQGKLLL